jgi:septal ring factor EnvC (AmiA/AmiB activator)
LIGIALYEEQDDVDKNFENDNANYSFKFLEKSIVYNSKKTFSLLSIKSLKTDDSLTKYLNEIAQMSDNDESHTLLAEWILEYAQKLLKLKHKIDQQKQINTEEQASTSKAANVTNMEIDEKQEAVEDMNKEREKRKNTIAEKTRSKALAKLNSMQKNFIKNNKELYEETRPVSISTDNHLIMSDIIIR